MNLDTLEYVELLYDNGGMGQAIRCHYASGHTTRHPYTTDRADAYVIANQMVDGLFMTFRSQDCLDRGEAHILGQPQPKPFTCPYCAHSLSVRSGHIERAISHVDPVTGHISHVESWRDPTTSMIECTGCHALFSPGDLFDLDNLGNVIHTNPYQTTVFLPF